MHWKDWTFQRGFQQAPQLIVLELAQDHPHLLWNSVCPYHSTRISHRTGRDQTAQRQEKEHLVRRGVLVSWQARRQIGEHSSADRGFKIQSPQRSIWLAAQHPQGNPEAEVIRQDNAWIEAQQHPKVVSGDLRHDNPGDKVGKVWVHPRGERSLCHHRGDS